MDNIKADIDYPVSFFFKDDSGVPATGATVSLEIYRISDDANVLTGITMTESGRGFYSYTISSTILTEGESYRVEVDGGATVGAAYRYQGLAIGVGFTPTAADLVGAGAGNVPKTILYEDSQNQPLSGVQVYLTTDIAGASRASGNEFSNSDGLVTFWGKSGDIRYAWGFHNGQTWNNPLTVEFT
jgi:hypothetical protein